MNVFIFSLTIISGVVLGIINIFKPTENLSMVTLILLTVPFFQMLASCQLKSEHGNTPSSGIASDDIFYLTVFTIIIGAVVKKLLWDTTKSLEDNILELLFWIVLWSTGTLVLAVIAKRIPFLKRLFALW